MTPAGLIVPLFNLHVLLLRELGRIRPQDFRVFFAGDGEISLYGTLPETQPTFIPRVLDMNSGSSMSPAIGISGADDVALCCEFIRIRRAEPRTLELFFRPSPGFDLDLTPERTRQGLMLPQIRRVIIDASGGRPPQPNPGLSRRGARPLRMGAL